MREDIKFFSDNGIHGIYICCASASPTEGTRENIDILALYLFQRLIWNADMTEEKFQAVIDDYLYVAYGEGGKFVGDYYKWLEFTDKPGCWPSMLGFGDPRKRIDFAKVRDDFELCISMFENAIKYAPSAKAEYGVRLASRSMYVRGLIAVYHDWYEIGNDEQRARYTELYEYLRDLAVNSSYIFARRKSAQLSDFDINENIGALINRFAPIPFYSDNWFNWQAE